MTTTTGSPVVRLHERRWAAWLRLAAAAALAAALFAVPETRPRGARARAGTAGGGDGADGWPHLRGPSYDGVSRVPALSPQAMKLIWKAQVGAGFSAVTIAGGRAFTMGNRDNRDIVTCLEAATGREIWTFGYACARGAGGYDGGPAATPTVHGGRVYAFSKAGQLHCLEAETGREVWSASAVQGGESPPTWGFAGSPTVVGDAVVLNAGDAGMALRADSGQVLWRSGGGGAGYASPIPFPASGGRTSVAVFAGSGLVGVEPESGRAMWTYGWRTPSNVNAACPVYVDGSFFVSSSYDVGCALVDITSGKPVERWRNKALKNHFASSILWKGHIYGIDGNAGRRAGLVCVEASTGRVAWRSSVEFGTVLLAGGHLLVLEETGRLSVVEARPDVYSEIASQQILPEKCWTVPTACGGRLFARNSEGDLVCWSLTGS
jgi:outer membrane protein assembly factor BamB